MDQAVELAGLFRDQQRELIAAFEGLEDGQRFGESRWRRAGLGEGRACVLEGGRVFERAGVNVSLVHGERVPQAVAEVRPAVAGRPFTAAGISLVLHPLNPYAPSFHANLRFFEVGGENGVWWF